VSSDRRAQRGSRFEGLGEDLNREGTLSARSAVRFLRKKAQAPGCRSLTSMGFGRYDRILRKVSPELNSRDLRYQALRNWRPTQGIKLTAALLPTRRVKNLNYIIII
jgi:hypothetical protein